MFREIEEDIKKLKYLNALKKLNKIKDERFHNNKYFILLAHVSFKCEEYALSSKTYKTIFQKNIQTTRSYAEYANILIKEKRNDKAINLLEEGLERFPKQVSFVRTLIGIAKKNNDLNYELELCEKLLQLESKNKVNHKLLINILLRNKDYKRVNIELQKAKKIFEINAFLLEEIQYFIALEKWDSALIKYKKLEKLTPKNYAIYIGQYRMCDKLKNYQGAEQALLKGEKYAENKFSILEALGNFYFRSRKYTLAIKYFKLLIELNHLDIKNYLKLAQIYQENENFSMAQQELNSCLKIDPNNNDILLNLGIIEMKLFNFDTAKTLFIKILKRTPNFAKAKTYLLALEREENTHNKKLIKYNAFSNLEPKNEFDYLIYIDNSMDFSELNDSINVCIEGLNKYPNNPYLLARFIILKLTNNDFSMALKSWNILLKKKNNHEALLFVINHSKKYSLFDSSIEKIVKKSYKNIKNSLLKNDFLIHNIAIIGGSNSIMRDGWYPVFQKNVSNLLNINVDNYGLGGISSLYGLFLIKEKKLFKQYNLIIFEYTLNDIYFNAFNGYDHILLESVIKEIVAEAKKYNCKIVFMLMSPLDNVKLLKENSCEITKIYTSIARHSPNAYLFNVYDFIDFNNYSSYDFYQMLYRDNMHYTSICAKNFANILSLKIITQDIFNCENDNLVLTHSKGIDLSNLRLLLPNEYKILGKHMYEKKGSAIISRNFLCIKNTTQIKVKIPKGKRVLALLINSSEYTGYIKVKFNNEIFIKNIFAERPINDPLKARIYLKQFTKTLVDNQKDTYLHISLELTESDIVNLELDTTVYPQPPRARLVDLELEIAGVLIS